MLCVFVSTFILILWIGHMTRGRQWNTCCIMDRGHMAAEEVYTAPNQPYGLRGTHCNYWFCAFTYFVSVYDKLFVLDALDGLKHFLLLCQHDWASVMTCLRDLQQKMYFCIFFSCILLFIIFFFDSVCRLKCKCRKTSVWCVTSVVRITFISVRDLAKMIL